MALTPSQQRAVECTGRPLFIQAGAGTGKTFTLTKRLAHGLASGAIPDVDNLLTITFTKKAAAELLGRVRAELRAQGLDDAALKIDAAWISTIDSMCHRILTAHAFEAGIDPGAERIDEARSDELLSQAFDEILAEQAGSPELVLLEDSLKGVNGIYAAVRKVIGLFARVEDGAASFCMGPAPRCSGQGLVQRALDICLTARDQLDRAEVASCDTTAAKCCDKIANNAEMLSQALNAPDADYDSWIWAMGALGQVQIPKRGNFMQEPGKSIFDDCREALDDVLGQAAASFAYVKTRALVAIADLVSERHGQLKRAIGAMDIDDMLIGCAHLLQDNPQIAQEYCQRFASIMIDEFQDTNRLQVAIARQLTDPELSTLATVGDAQQSIYGFRGADLEVYREMRDEMAQHGADNVALDINFRSHSGILQFVEAVFSTPEFFGGEFLKVSPGPANDRDRAWIAHDDAHVWVELVAGRSDSSGKKFPKIDRLRRAEAERIAERFEQLHAQGAEYGDMAVLLRSMKKASLYTEALRARGIPCVISGGSMFFTSPEVGTIVMLLRFLENPDDDEAVFALLSSPLCDIDDDDLLALSVLRGDVLRPGTGSMRKKASLYDALRYRVEKELNGVEGPLTRARDVLEDALHQAVSQPFAAVLMHAVHASGWYALLAAGGVDGAAVQANIQHMCDLVDDYERRFGHSIVKTAEYFRSICDLAAKGFVGSGKPATMRSPGNAAVQIMTFHASKGLEFPIVAVAEYDSHAQHSSEVRAVSEDGATYLAWPPSKSSLGGERIVCGEDVSGSCARASDTVSFLIHAQERVTADETAEAQRLLYVALTRAKDLLLVMGADKKYADTGTLMAGSFASMMAAAFPDGMPGDGDFVRTRTGALVGFTVTCVDAESESDSAVGAAAPEPHVHVAAALAAPAPHIHARLPRTEQVVFSYSSLAAQSHAGQEADPRDVPPASIQLRDRSQDAKTVSPVGSAFHLVAQWLAGCAAVDARALDERIHAAAATFELGPAERARLEDIVASWGASSLYAATRGYPLRYPEHEFAADVNGLTLEGSIDLLCCDSSSRQALIVDYKTGTSGSGDELRQRYRLQACCYAYAVLAAGGYDSVEMVFVRPEVDMEEVRFDFSVDDIPRLASVILSA